jgi:hypothetical protein
MFDLQGKIYQKNGFREWTAARLGYKQVYPKLEITPITCPPFEAGG